MDEQTRTDVAAIRGSLGLIVGLLVLLVLAVGVGSYAIVQAINSNGF